MTTTTPTLTTWLLDQIAADEDAAHYCLTREPMSWGGQWYGDAKHYERHDPAHVLAVCAAHRSIVEHPPYRYDDGARSDSAYEQWEADVRALAAIYADRDGFREEWRA